MSKPRVSGCAAPGEYLGGYLNRARVGGPAAHHGNADGGENRGRSFYPPEGDGDVVVVPPPQRLS